MSRRKQRKLESAVATVQQRYGTQALYKADRLHNPMPPHIGTGFDAFDAITGCGGIPLGAITLLGGYATSGKLTLAYKALAHAQQRAGSGRQPALVGIIDFTHNSDPDYLARCGINLEHLLIARPERDPRAVELMIDLIRSRRVRMLLVDGLADLVCEKEIARQFNAALGSLTHHVRQNGCALLLIDEPEPPWWRRLANLLLSDPTWSLRQTAALHVEIERERWLRHSGRLVGYRAQARVLRSRWRPDRARAPIEIEFNGTVRARSTW